MFILKSDIIFQTIISVFILGVKHMEVMIDGAF